MALQTLPPVNHKVINGMEATYCEVCKQTHGYGQYNKIIPLKAVAFKSRALSRFCGNLRPSLREFSGSETGK
jgi:hypothetical protein